MTFEELVALFNEADIRATVDSDREQILAVYGGRRFPNLMLRATLRHGDLVQVVGLVQLGMGQVPEARQLETYRKLMNLNYRKALAKVSVDASDGEVLVWTDCLLGSNPLEESQLQRLISACLSTTEDAIDILVKATADASEMTPTGANIDELMEDLFPGEKEEDAGDSGAGGESEDKG